MSSSTQKGFSIIELIVAMTVFVTISSVLLINYNSINHRLTLDTLVHQVAQWTRETQVSAMSVRSHSGGFFQGYGLHFDQASTTDFVFFADLPSGISKQYDPIPGGQACGDAGVECTKVVTMNKGVKIDRICGFVPSPAVPTYQGACPSNFDQLDSLDVVFTRPNPDAEITGKIMGVPLSYGNVVVTIRSVTGYERSVNIWTTGQVTVQ